jgi:hypothetical protein
MNREQAQHALDQWARAKLRAAVRAEALRRARAYAEHDIAQTRSMYAYQAAMLAAQRLLKTIEK